MTGCTVLFLEATGSKQVCREPSFHTPVGFGNGHLYGRATLPFPLSFSHWDPEEALMHHRCLSQRQLSTSSGGPHSSSLGTAHWSSRAPRISWLCASRQPGLPHSPGLLLAGTRDSTIGLPLNGCPSALTFSSDVVHSSEFPGQYHLPRFILP